MTPPNGTSVVVVGGGVSGCAAAVAAAKLGAEVTLVERTDLLGGAALRAGRMNGNAKMVLAEESKALGAPEIFETIEGLTISHGTITGETGTYVYDCGRIDSALERTLSCAGVRTLIETRAETVTHADGRVASINLSSGERLPADAFVDATGGAGGVPICTEHGRGCVMCFYRCPSYGDRISIATEAGAPEFMMQRPGGGYGAIGASMILYKDSLSKELHDQLESSGSVAIPFPPDLIDYTKVSKMGNVRTRKQMETLNLVDIGVGAKCVGAQYIPVADLRRLPGLERVHIENPARGGLFNKIGMASMTYRDDQMRVRGFINLLCAGEKSGPSTGVAEAVATGAVAGSNAARIAAGADPVTLPQTTMLGDYITYCRVMVESSEGKSTRYSASVNEYFRRLTDRGFYPATTADIWARIGNLGLRGVLAEGRRAAR